MDSLPVFLRVKNQPVILLGDGEAAEAKRRLLERAGARVVDESEDARIAVVALANDADAHAAIARLKARGLLVNAVDRLDQCDFTMPAIIDRDPVLVAIGTSGASAGLAKALRITIEALLPPTLGNLARALAGARQSIRARWPDARERRHAIDTVLAAAGALDPLSGADAVSVDRWLGGTATERTEGRIETIMLRSGDPDELTLRQARLLGRADRIVHTPDIPAAILDRARADAVRIASKAAPDTEPDGFTLWLRWSD